MFKHTMKTKKLPLTKKKFTPPNLKTSLRASRYAIYNVSDLVKISSFSTIFIFCCCSHSTRL